MFLPLPPRRSRCEPHVAIAATASCYRDTTPYLIISAASSPLKDVVSGLPLGDDSTRPLCPPLRSVRPTEAASSLQSNVLYAAGVGGNRGPLDAVAVCPAHGSRGEQHWFSPRKLSMYTCASLRNATLAYATVERYGATCNPAACRFYLCAVAEYFMISRATMLHHRSSLSDGQHKT